MYQQTVPNSNFKRSIGFLFVFISIIGSLVVLHYLDNIKSTSECTAHAPKQFDFINKYNMFVLIFSLASVIFLWFGFI